jgi:hypothetical protein
MTEHRWSGWPGAWCLDCGREDPMEVALAEGRCDADGNVILTPDDLAAMECVEPGSNRHNPYTRSL